MEFLTLEVDCQDFYVEFLTPEVDWQDFHVEFLTPEVDWQDFYVEFLTPEVDWQDFYVEFLTLEVDWQDFYVEFLTPEVDWQEFHVELLTRELGRQKTAAVFCAAGLHVKKQWIFSAPEGQASKNNDVFLHIGRKSALVNAYLIRSRGETGFARGGMGVSPRSFRQKWTMFRRFRTPVCRISP